MPSTVDTTSDSSATNREFSDMDFSRMSLQELKQSIRSKPTAKRKWLNIQLEDLQWGALKFLLVSRENQECPPIYA